MSTTHETPIVAPEATAPTSTVEKAALISTVEPIVETTKPVTAAEPTITEPSTTEAAPITETTKDTKAEEFVKVEAPPITSGNLGYKTGPLK